MAGLAVRWTWAAVVGLALGVGVAAAAPGEIAKARSITGQSFLLREGRTSDVGPATEFREGDIVRVPADARLTIEFADGATMSLVGAPTALRFGPMDGKGRRVVLGSGVVSEAAILGIALEIQAPDPYDASLVLQNARGAASVSLGDRVVFRRLEGIFAKVWRDKKYQELGAEAWLLNVRDVYPATVRPAPGAAPAGSRQVGDAIQVKLGDRVITYYPAANFAAESLADGGLRLTYRGGDFGVVIVGRDTNLFLADGDSVTFDGRGDVTAFDGISHLYHPLTDVRMDTNPVENSAEASPTSPTRR